MAAVHRTTRGVRVSAVVALALTSPAFAQDRAGVVTTLEGKVTVTRASRYRSPDGRGTYLLRNDILPSAAARRMASACAAPVRTSCVPSIPTVPTAG